MSRHRPKTVAALALVLLLIMMIWIMRGLIVEKSPAVPPSPMESSGLAGGPEGQTSGDASLVAGPGTAPGPITLTPNPGSGAATNPSRVDPADFKYPVKTGQLEKLGKFEEREVRVFRHPDGSIRVHRLLETEMKYPLVFVEEVFSGESGTLARQTMAVGDHLMVQFVSGTGRPAIEAAVQGAGFTVRKWFQQPGLVLVGIPDADLDSLGESLARISSLPTIESAERDDLVFAN
jgi:hypothetical protein